MAKKKKKENRRIRIRRSAKEREQHTLPKLWFQESASDCTRVEICVAFRECNSLLLDVKEFVVPLLLVYYIYIRAYTHIFSVVIIRKICSTNYFYLFMLKTTSCMNIVRT